MKPIVLVERGAARAETLKGMVECGYIPLIVYDINSVKFISPISDKSMAAIRKYLVHHDKDIANSINDFGDLSEVFKELIGALE